MSPDEAKQALGRAVVVEDAETSDMPELVDDNDDVVEDAETSYMPELVDDDDDEDEDDNVPAVVRWFNAGMRGPQRRF